MENLSERISVFLEKMYGARYVEWSGYGYGDGYGAGDENGTGAGYGEGTGYGTGYGKGAGDGSGSRRGSGSGSGSGFGSGIGSWSGSGYGDGAMSGIKEFNGHPVVTIDGIETIIHQIHGNVEKGETLSRDLTTTPCCVVKQGGIFAHGETLREAMSALRDKLFADMPEENRIAAFVAEHDYNTAYPCRDLYEWHHRLTGSCEMGRKQFAKEHGIDIENDSRTVKEFIDLTKNAYGGEIIRKVEGKYREKSSNLG